MFRSLLTVAVLAFGTSSIAAATEVQKVTSPQGIEAWLVEESAIPLISVVITIEGGGRADPQGKEGAVTVMSALLNEGAGPYDAQAFARELQDKAIRIGAGSGLDSISISMSTLSENKDRAFELLGLLLNEPRFDADAMERVRGQMVSVLKQETEDPGTIASRAWWAAAYPNHPYGRSENGTPESIAALTLDDIKSVYQARIGRDRVRIAVVGDISPEDLAARIDPLLAKLPANAAAETPALVDMTGQGTLSVIKRDDPQSTVLFGAPGLMRKDPDYMAANVLNYILGGGSFSSRLMDEVREKRGITYGISTWLDPSLWSGLISGSVASDNAKVAEAITITKQEMARLRDEGPTEKEVADAKAYLTGSFALRLDTNAKIAGFLASSQLYDLGIDYINRRNAEIEAVTVDDVRRVAQRLLDPQKFSFVVVGQPAGL
jgi:zinc protease